VVSVLPPVVRVPDGGVIQWRFMYPEDGFKTDPETSLEELHKHWSRYEDTVLQRRTVVVSDWEEVNGS
jgi:hypothetical protein